MHDLPFPPHLPTTSRSAELILLQADPLISQLPKALPLHARIVGPLLAGPPKPLPHSLVQVGAQLGLIIDTIKQCRGRRMLKA